MSIVVAVIAVELIDHVLDPRANVPHVAIAVPLAATPPIRIATTASAEGVVTVRIGLFGCNDFVARILQVADCRNAVASIIALVMLQLIDCAIQATMNMREI